MQGDYASRRKTRTKNKNRNRQWIYDYLQEHGIEGKSVLCVGARDDSEVDFFTNKGHNAIGIDLYDTRAIINCDMSKMHEHPKLKDMRFDIVFSSESLEHCLDIEGFVKGLNLVCKKYFVCMFHMVEAPNYWDCHKFDFAEYVGTDRYNEELVKIFPGFELVTSEVHKRGRRGFFILKKKSAYIESEGRTYIMKYLPRNAVCAELGVYSGRFSKEILRHLSPKKLYLIDPYWKSYGDAFDWNGESTVNVWNKAVQRVRQYDTNDIAVMVVDYDYNFLEDLPDKFFDWIYLDTTHEYEDTLRELDLIARKVKDDGLIAGHDWHENPKNKHYGVYKAMKKWLKLNPEYYLCYRDDRSQWILKHTE